MRVDAYPALTRTIFLGITATSQIKKGLVIIDFHWIHLSDNVLDGTMGKIRYHRLQPRLLPALLQPPANFESFHASEQLNMLLADLPSPVLIENKSLNLVNRKVTRPYSRGAKHNTKIVSVPTRVDLLLVKALIVRSWLISQLP